MRVRISKCILREISCIFLSLLLKHDDREVKELWAKLKAKIPQYFEGLEVKPSLLHGDLWGGNIGQIETGPGILMFFYNLLSLFDVLLISKQQCCIKCAHLYRSYYSPIIYSRACEMLFIIMLVKSIFIFSDI